ncbi:hypothetical protein [Endothiovibrio diazotrophicus]
MKKFIFKVSYKKLALGIVVSIFAIVGIFYFSDYSTNKQYASSGIDVLNDCGLDIEAVAMIHPLFENKASSILIGIVDFNKIKTKCTHFKFILPGNTPDVLFYKNDSNNQGGYVQLPTNITSLSPLGYRSVEIDLKDFQNFTGNIFTLVQNLNKKSMSEYELYFQFFSAKEQQETLKNSVKSIKVSMPLDNSYNVIPVESRILTRKPILNQSVYWFDINRNSPLLEILIEDESLNKWKNLFSIISVIILGLSIPLLINSFITKSQK